MCKSASSLLELLKSIIDKIMPIIYSMNVLGSKVIQYIAIGLGVIIVVVLGIHRYLSFDLYDLESIILDKKANIEIRNKDNIYQLNYSQSKLLISDILSMEVTNAIGNKGEYWVNYCVLDIESSSSMFNYQIKFHNRNSMKGVVLATLQRSDGFGSFIYTNYIGNKLIERLNLLSNGICKNENRIP